MITAKDINTKRFEQAKPGYKPEEVDEFLRQLSDQMTAIAREKEEAESKIAVLVESIRKYKSEEEDLKDAILSARKQERIAAAEAKEKADAIIEEAQRNADNIISAANVKAKDILGNAYTQAQEQQAELDRLRQEVNGFKANLLEMYRDHIALITSIPGDDEDEEEEVQAQEVPADEETLRELAAASEGMEATRVIETPAV